MMNKDSIASHWNFWQATMFSILKLASVILSDFDFFLFDLSHATGLDEQNV